MHDRGGSEEARRSEGAIADRKVGGYGKAREKGVAFRHVLYAEGTGAVSGEAGAVLASAAHPAAADPREAPDRAAQSGLARAVLAYDPEYFARVDGDGDVLQRLDLAVFDGDARKLKEGIPA